MSENTLAGDLIVGARPIAAELGLTERQVFYMAETGQLPVFKIGRKLAAKRSTLRQHIAELERSACEKAS
jgi:predicted transcriptional regulator